MVETRSQRASAEQDEEDAIPHGSDGIQEPPLSEREAAQAEVISLMRAQMAEMALEIAALRANRVVDAASPPAGDVHPTTATTLPTTAVPPPVYVPSSGTRPIECAEPDLKSLIEAQVQAALAARDGESIVRRGRPYPEAYEYISYPPGFVPPQFPKFDGIGNPSQHIAQFRALCCNVGSNDPLLLRLFVGSLSGVAFSWFYNVPNDTFKTFAELEDAFVRRFAGVEHQVTIDDLMAAQKRPDERLYDFIVRWRNLNMQCEPQLQESHAVSMVMNKITGPISVLLKISTIKTFAQLLERVSSLQSTAGTLILKEGHEQSKWKKPSGVGPSRRPAESMALSNVGGKLKKPIMVAEPATPPPKKKVSLEEKKSKTYSFKKECVKKIFKNLLKQGMTLPTAKRPSEVEKCNEPDYCPYHRCLGHTIEECFVFKDWLEAQYKAGQVEISDQYLLKPKTHGAVRMVTIVTPRKDDTDAPFSLPEITENDVFPASDLCKSPGKSDDVPPGNLYPHEIDEIKISTFEYFPLFHICMVNIRNDKKASEKNKSISISYSHSEEERAKADTIANSKPK